MIVKQPSKHQLEKISLKVAAQAGPSLHLSKCHIVGNHMLWLISHSACGLLENVSILLENMELN